jgi:5-methylcytosine-specific restriction enzyme A
MRQHGRLFCEACGAEPELRFSDRGRSVIEAHQVRPLHSLVEGDTTRLDDLELICANCHRLIHGGLPWLTLDDLRASLQGYEQRDHGCDCRGLGGTFEPCLTAPELIKNPL